MGYYSDFTVTTDKEGTEDAIRAAVETISGRQLGMHDEPGVVGYTNTGWYEHREHMQAVSALIEGVTIGVHRVGENCGPDIDEWDEEKYWVKDGTIIKREVRVVTAVWEDQPNIFSPIEKELNDRIANINLNTILDQFKKDKSNE